MRHLKYIFTAAIAAALAFASCTKEIEAPDETGQEEESYSRETGAPVVFGVSTGYDNGPETKVEYSGVTFGGYERISWETDDRMSIYCAEVSAPASWEAEYKISGPPENAGRYSVAYIKAAGDSWLKWGENDMHHFYGVYPKYTENPDPGIVNKIKSVEFQQACLSVIAEIPRTKEHKGEPIMTAYTRASKNESTPVTLDFSPDVNTFDITIINKRNEPINLKSVGLKSISTYLSGEYNIVIFTDLIPTTNRKEYSFWLPIKHKSVQQDYPEGLTLAPNASHKVTLYTVPIDIKELNLILEETNSKVSVLEFKKNGEWINFPGGKKYNMNNIEIHENPEDFYYTFDITAPDTVRFTPFDLRYPHKSCEPQIGEIKVKSYKVNSDGSKNYAVSWEHNFYNNSNFWEEHPGLPGNSATGGEETLVLRRPKPDIERSLDYLHQIGRFSYYTEGGDLSFTESPNFGYKHNTANCYIVKAKGVYKFPAVYGNAIKNTLDNPDAYRITGSTGTNVLTVFKDGAGNPITQPYIFDAHSVELVWEDAEGLIQELSLETNARPKNWEYFPKNGKYIHFKIWDKVNFANAVIAVKNKAGVILWTWHIWVGYNISSTEGSDFANRPLGYRMSRIGKAYDYKSKIEFRQKDAKGKVKYINERGIGNVIYPGCVYYAFGRMTPMMSVYPSYYRHNNKNITCVDKCYTGTFNASGVRTETREFIPEISAKKSVSDAISSPGTICELSSPGYSHPYWNLWNNNYTTQFNAVNDANLTTKKTVYDPCPFGYCVPSKAKINNEQESTVTNWYKMGGFGNCFSNSEGINIPAHNYGKRSSYHSAYGSRHYPSVPAAGETFDEVVYLPIYPVKESQ